MCEVGTKLSIELHDVCPFKVVGGPKPARLMLTAQAASLVASFLAFWSACCWCMIHV